MFKKILIANRSEIAVRVINACRSLGVGTVAVYSDADEHARHRLEADESVHIGPPPPRESYLDIDKIIAAAKATGCDAIHPGYGFLAENPQLPQRCSQENIVFIGPSAKAMRLMGNKVASRVKMIEAGIPLVPGMQSSATEASVFAKAADEAGYPVMIKAAAGGGGKGMRVVNEAAALPEAIDAARREALNAFNDDTVYLEKYISDPRHIEFQILADQHGNCVHLFERECSIQRRHQKIIEETPSVALDDDLRTRMGNDAVKVAQAADYVGAGTVEFLLDQSGQYYFLEMNTRIQVEHPVTEMVVGVDLVTEQIRIAAGMPMAEAFNNLSQRGHAIECRLYAEDGDNNFLPSTGTILHYHEPTGPGIRVDSGVSAGSVISIDYDPIMAKLIVHAPDRASAIAKMVEALKSYQILGVKTSREFMIDCLEHKEFGAGRTYTSFIEQHLAERVSSAMQVRHLAAAVAAVAELHAVGSSSAGGQSDHQPSPWQTLGSWQIGQSIHE